MGGSDMDDRSLELSVDLSKISTNEGTTTLSAAALGEAAQRRADAISGEKIRKDEELLGTYTVSSDEITGGMGSVWKVRHESWNTYLAMKRPQPRFFAEAGPERKAAFVRECENWINLGLHPNIVSCYYVREIGGVPTIFSEWMDGGSLKDRIRDGSLYAGSGDEVKERILDIAVQALRGLAYSHERGLIHQDMKPGNLLLTADFDAKIADFGLAKAETYLDVGNAGPRHGAANLPVSTGYTLEYCPIEQMEGAEPEEWMDIYAWALTVLEMYCGRRLWKTGAEAKDHYREYFARCRVEIPEKLQELICHALTRKACTPQAAGLHTAADLEKALLVIYEEVTGETYFRPEAKAASDTADSLNNRALSFLDLGYAKEAEELWEKALQYDEDHVDSLYNRELNLLRGSRKYDFQVIASLQQIETRLQPASDGEPGSLSEQIRRECGGNYGAEEETPCYIIDGVAEGCALVDERLYFFLLDDTYEGALIGLKNMPKTCPEEAVTDEMAEVREWGKPPEINPIIAYFKRKKDRTEVLSLCLSPTGELALVQRTGGEMCLYDTKKKRILRDIGPEYCGDEMLFSPDGSMLVSRPPFRPQGPARFTLMKLPSMEVVSEGKMTFVCFLPEGKFLLRGRRENADRQPGSESLFVCGTDGGMREVFSFEEVLDDAREYHSEKGFLLFCRYRDSGRTFLVDETWQEIPVSRMMFQASEKIEYLDPMRGLLYTAFGSWRIAVWDYRKGKCLCTFPFSMTAERSLWDEKDRKLLYYSHMRPDTEHPVHQTMWYFLPLPERREDTKPAAWRVSRIVTTGRRSEEDRALARLTAQFRDFCRRGQYGEAAKVHGRCFEIEGFSMSPEDTEMIAVLEEKAARRTILGVQLMKVLPKMPPVSFPVRLSHYDDDCSDTMCSIRSCADGLTALEERFHGDARVVLYDEERDISRVAKFSRQVQTARVRGDRIFTFSSDGIYAVYDLEGEDLKVPAGWPPEKRKNPIWYYCHDMDSAGERILCSRNKPAVGSRRHFYQKNLRTGRILRLGEGNDADWQGACYFSDDTILLYGKTGFLRIGPEEGEVIRSWESGYEEISSVYVYLPPERDCIFAAVVRRRGLGDYTLQYDPDGNLLAKWEWNGWVLPLPKNRFVVEPRSRWIRDIRENKVVYRFPGGDIRIRPDGREFYAETVVPGNDGKGKQETAVGVWRIEYGYECAGPDEKQEKPQVKTRGASFPAEVLDNRFDLFLPGDREDDAAAAEAAKKAREKGPWPPHQAVGEFTVLPSEDGRVRMIMQVWLKDTLPMLEKDDDGSGPDDPMGKITELMPGEDDRLMVRPSGSLPMVHVAADSVDEKACKKAIISYVRYFWEKGWLRV